MQPGLKAATIGAPHSGMLPEALECSLQCPERDRRPILTKEERTADTSRWIPGIPPDCIFAEHFRQIPADGNQSRLEEFGVADGEQGIRQVHVADRQVQRLLAAQPRPIHHQQNHTHGRRLDPRRKSWTRWNRLQKAANLRTRVDVRDEFRRTLRQVLR